MIYICLNKCLKCKNSSLIKVDDYEKNFIYPKCSSEDFNFGISGCWDKTIGDDEGGVVLYEVVEHRYTYNYYGDENFEDIEVVAFNIDELIFETEDERNGFYENGEGEYNRDSEQDIVFYNGNRNNETFYKLSELIDENDDYEQGDGDWRLGNVFKSLDGADKHRNEKYVIPFKKNN